MRWERFHGYLDKDCGGLEQGREKLRSEQRTYFKERKSCQNLGEGVDTGMCIVLAKDDSSVEVLRDWEKCGAIDNKWGELCMVGPQSLVNAIYCTQPKFAQIIIIISQNFIFLCAFVQFFCHLFQEKFRMSLLLEWKTNSKRRDSLKSVYSKHLTKLKIRQR